MIIITTSIILLSVINYKLVIIFLIIMPIALISIILTIFM